MPAVLLVDDDAGITEPLAVALDREGYRTDVAASAAEALTAIESAEYQLVLLDLGLPDGDGVQVCREIRRKWAQVPVMMLTARAAEIDIVVGLDAGADDYLVKPFRLAELLARMRALIRRSNPADELVVGPLHVDAAARIASVDDAALDLSPREFDLLGTLARDAGAVVSRAVLVEQVWESAIPASSRTIDTHVSSLRRKLAEAGGPLIDTVRGAGFRLHRR